MNQLLNPVYTKNHLNSSKYTQVFSSDVISLFEKENFILENTVFKKTRSERKNGFQKHVLIFTRPDLQIDSENQIRVLVTNSHDGSSSFRINLGIYRFVCSNGLIVGETFFNAKIRHSAKNITLKINEAIDEVVRLAPVLKANILKMQSTTVADYSLFEKNLSTYFKKPLFSEDLFKVRREADKSPTLYNAFNVVQENILNGGIRYTILDQDDVKIKKTRKIKSLDTNFEVNQLLWETASQLLSA